MLSAGYEPTAVADFASAKAYLDKRPDLLITEVKLGAYNGLHLAIRASIHRTPTIVMGDVDAVLKADAERQQATYLTQPVDPQKSLTIVRELLQGSRHSRRSTRKQVPPVNALVNDVPAHLRDVSYEGMRIEAAEHDSPPQYFDIRLPQFNFSCRAQRVWTSPAGEDGRGCGAGRRSQPPTAKPPVPGERSSTSCLGSPSSIDPPRFAKSPQPTLIVASADGSASECTPDRTTLNRRNGRWHWYFRRKPMNRL